MALYYIFIAPVSWFFSLQNAPAELQYSPVNPRPMTMVESEVDSELALGLAWIEVGGGINPIISRIILIAAILIIGYFLFLLFKYYVKNRVYLRKILHQNILVDAEYEVTALEKSDSWLPSFRRAPAIRRYYQKFLKLCSDKGMRISLADTSMTIEKKANRRVNDAEALSILRKNYVKARYSDKMLTKEDEILVKDAFNKIRATMVKEEHRG